MSQTCACSIDETILKRNNDDIDNIYCVYIIFYLAFWENTFLNLIFLGTDRRQGISEDIDVVMVTSRIQIIMFFIIIFVFVISTYKPHKICLVCHVLSW